MTTLQNATNVVVSEFLSRPIDRLANALLDGQHFEYTRGMWILYNRYHAQIDQAKTLSALIHRNYEAAA